MVPGKGESYEGQVISGECLGLRKRFFRVRILFNFVEVGRVVVSVQIRDDGRDSLPDISPCPLVVFEKGLTLSWRTRKGRGV